MVKEWQGRAGQVPRLVTRFSLNSTLTNVFVVYSTNVIVVVYTL